MDYLLEIFGAVTLGKTIEIFASLSIYSFPVLMFLNMKIQSRRMDLLSKDHISMNDMLRLLYVKKVLQWILILVLYIASIILGKTEDMSNLVYPISIVYFGYSWALISIEIKSILSSYKEVKSELYVPVLKRYSFWILMLASTFKVWQFSRGTDFGAPSQIIAILDLASYTFIFGSLFIFVYFDKRKNIIEKTLRKSRKIVISMKDDVVRSERYRTKRNREITKVLTLLRLCISLIEDERKIKDIMKSIKELELLLITS